MSDLGCQLKKLLHSRSFSGSALAYLYAGVLSSGPWIISIFSIALLHLFLRPWLELEERTLFSTTITHAYALALILTGPLQLVLIKHTFGELARQGRAGVFPVLVSALTLAGAISFTGGLLLFGFLTDESLLYKAGAVTLVTNVAMIFVVTICLGALQCFRGVVSGFLAGYAASFLLAWFAAGRWGAAAAVAGFSTGHALLLVVMILLLRRELDTGPKTASWSFARAFQRFPGLALCGLLYNLGIWIDKILFWWLGQGSLAVSGILRASPTYDLAIYLSFLSIVPGFSVFFLQLETGISTAFNRFFDAANQGGTLEEIENAKREVVRALQVGSGRLIGVQGAVTLILLITAGHLGELVGIGALQLGIFRVTLIGAFLLIIFLSMLTILFHLDDRRGALVSAAIFCLGNALLSWVTLQAYEAWYGFGFVAAAAAASLFAALRVNLRVERFELYVFNPGRA